jgi:hypothetical protein
MTCSNNFHRAANDNSGLQDNFNLLSQKLLEINRVNALSGDALSNEFNSIVARDGLNMFSSFSMFFAVVCDFIGLDSVADHFKKSIVVESAVDAFTKAAENVEVGNSEPEIHNGPCQNQRALQYSYAP